MKTMKSVYQSPRVDIVSFAGVTAMMYGSPASSETISYSATTIGAGGRTGD